MGNETRTSGRMIMEYRTRTSTVSDTSYENNFFYKSRECARGNKASLCTCLYVFFRRRKALSLLRAGTGEQLPKPSPRTLLGGGWLVRGQMHKRGNGRRSIMMIRDATLPMRVKDFRACGWERREGGAPRRHASSRAARRRRDPVTRHKCGRMWRQRRARRRRRRGARRADRMESGVDAQRRLQ